jgi:ATP-dependent helicase HrpB
LANGRVLRLNADDALLREQWLAVAQLDAGSGNEGKIFLAAPLDEQDLLHLAKEQEVVGWDNQKGILVAAIETRIGNITLHSKPMQKISDELRVQILCNAIRDEGWKLLNRTPQTDNWQARVLSLHLWRPEEGWPDVSDQYLMQTLETWLGPFLHGINKRDELQRIDIAACLQTLLPWELQRQLDDLAPEKIKVPTGSMITLTYQKDGSPPEMAVRLQELFGMPETPAVNQGRNKVMLHLLSPAYRPVQVTQDLKSFWDTTYAAVRKDLRGRYPKHHWPEDPWTAEAVRGVKRRS